MSYPKTIRLHVEGSARPKVEPYARFCMANHLTREEGVLLLAAWERRGYIKRRADGGFDVLKHHPRLTHAEAEEFRKGLRCT